MRGASGIHRALQTALTAQHTRTANIDDSSRLGAILGEKWTLWKGKFFASENRCLRAHSELGIKKRETPGARTRIPEMFHLSRFGLVAAGRVYGQCINPWVKQSASATSQCPSHSAKSSSREWDASSTWLMWDCSRSPVGNGENPARGGVNSLGISAAPIENI